MIGRRGEEEEGRKRSLLKCSGRVREKWLVVDAVSWRREEKEEEKRK